MKNKLTNHLGKLLAVVMLPLLVSAGFAQQGPQAADLGLERNGELVLAESGQVLELGGGQVIDGDVIVSGGNSGIIVRPGVQTINGDIRINGGNGHIRFEFSENKENGHLKVGGTFQLGPDNSPMLNIDLSKTHLTKGEVFTLVSAGQIVGEFSGMASGDKLVLGDYEIKITYNPDSITLMVLKAPRRPHPRAESHPSITPVTEIDGDLIDPTSTAPRGW